MFFFDPTFVLLIPAIILMLYAQWKVTSTFNKFSKVASARGITGAQVAYDILRANGKTINIEQIPGSMTDHYDPRAQVLRLSSTVFGSTSVAALGVAAHEAGHALQHQDRYVPLMLRNAIAPIAGFGSNLAFFLLLAGFLFNFLMLIKVAIVFYAAAVVFSVITLPVEFNASRRALRILGGSAYLSDDELAGARKVLGAAALTYVAATAMSVLQLLRMILLARSSD